MALLQQLLLQERLSQPQLGVEHLSDLSHLQ
jgi:hypothetical protein